MRYQRRLRRAAGTGLLCAALAGCGSTTATAQPHQAAAAQSHQATAAAAAAPATGCAAVNQATAVTVHRRMRLVVPTSGGSLTATQRNPALVRALFRDFCAVVAHPAPRSRVIGCPADFGLDYTGTFYAGTRVLAAFAYGASGCQRVSLTAGGATRSATVSGAAAAAAPHLESDMAAVLGLPRSAVSQPLNSVNPGGPMKSVTP
ncbi:MAG TPA: hypothetical protein VKV35_01260 [Streptosporangiaceae bacterium]|nr:hypothetical protein [Streptosporangiaceae bacterium]